MENLILNTSVNLSAEEEREIIDAFDGISLSINKGIRQLDELSTAQLIIDLSIGVAGGAILELLKLAVQKLRNKEKDKIKKKIIQRISYKNKKIIITKDSISIFELESNIIVSSIEEAINKIDDN